MKPAANPNKMPAAKSPSLALICGDDEFAVKARAKQLHQQWCEDLGGMDHETIEAAVANSGEALTALARLREALQTLPFFGTGKVIWLRDCNFLGDERAATAQAVTETLNELAEELKKFSWQGVRLLISAGKVDKRKTFFKTLDKIGRLKRFPAGQWTTATGGTGGSRGARGRPPAAKGNFRGSAGGTGQPRRSHPRQLDNEVEKLCLFAGDRKRLEVADVAAICTRNKTARAFALGDALATGICRACCGGWTRNCGKSNPARKNRKLDCCTV